MEKRKIYGTIVGIVFFVIIIVGLTYAYFYWASGDNNKTNVNLTVSRSLEGLIVYNQGVSILETDNASLQAINSYTEEGAISATIEFWKRPAATQEIYGQISLEILKMLSASNSTDANIGKSETVKWALTTYTVEDSTEVLIQEGTFKGKEQEDKFPMSNAFPLNSIQTFYKVYLWLDANAMDPNYPVTNEILSVEISASASDVATYYDSLGTLANLGLYGDLKGELTTITSISPVETGYAVSNAPSQSVNLNSNITGNRTLGTGYTFNEETGEYTLTDTSTSQAYNNSAVGKYTCHGTATTCSTMYKINSVMVSDASTNYSEPSIWGGTTLTSSSNRAVASTYTFDGTYYQLDQSTLQTGVSFTTSHIGLYTCANNTGTNCTNIYLINSISSGTTANVSSKGRNTNYNYMTNADIYTTTAGYDQSDIGIFQAEDDIGVSYFFRGNVANNYVKFGKYTEDAWQTYNTSTGAVSYGTSCTSGTNITCTQIASAGDDMYWRIIRINGDGTVRMIYAGTDAHPNGEERESIGVSAYNINSDDNAYVGYMYGATGQTTYDATHANTNNSTIKSVVDAWYLKYLNSSYSSNIADAIYCNDRKVVTDDSKYKAWCEDDTKVAGTGIGTSDTMYGTFARLEFDTDLNFTYLNFTEANPTLKCEQVNDRFTKNGSTIVTTDGLGTNEDLTYPIGLITSDEVLFAGGYLWETNELYYLNSGKYYWTMGPSYFDDGYALVLGVSDVGFFSSYGRVDGSRGVFPALSLASTAITGGTGTMIDPFTVG